MCEVQNDLFGRRDSPLLVEILMNLDDGDCMSTKMVYSNEANEEAYQICYSVKNFLNSQGKLMRDVGNEAYLTFYNMTRKD